jgi:hypothetical protein
VLVVLLKLLIPMVAMLMVAAAQTDPYILATLSVVGVDRGQVPVAVLVVDFLFQVFAIFKQQPEVAVEVMEALFLVALVVVK